MDIDRIVKALSRVPGIQAVVLGGSRSRGEAMEHSDYDIGVYYDAGQLVTTKLGQCLKSLDDEGREGLLHPPGEWGPWINGGAWLTVEGTAVDVLLRDIGRVAEVLCDCTAGRITIDYQCGHPFGFVNLIYAAEIHFCKPLWQDASEPVSYFKAMLAEDNGYPKVMQQAVIRKFMWEAQFSLACGRKPAHNHDVNYAMGSVFRASCAWAEILYALNGKYLMNEKGALKHLNKLVLCAADMESRICTAYSLLAAGEAKKAYALLDSLHAEIELLAGTLQ